LYNYKKSWKKQQKMDVHAEQKIPANVGKTANAHAHAAKVENVPVKENAPVAVSVMRKQNPAKLDEYHTNQKKLTINTLGR